MTNIITDSNSNNMKAYIFMTVFFLPMVFVLRLFPIIDLIINPSSVTIIELVKSLATVVLLASLLCLRKHKKEGLYAFFLFVFFMMVESAMEWKQLEDPSVVNQLLSLAQIAVLFMLAVVAFFYMKKRWDYFGDSKETEDDNTVCAENIEIFEAPAQASLVEESIPEKKLSKKNNIFVYGFWCVLGAYLICGLCSVFADTFTYSLNYLGSFTQKLLTYPYPGSVPKETPYYALRALMTALISGQAVYTVNKMGIMTYEDLGLTKSRKPLSSILKAFFIGIAIVLITVIYLLISGCFVGKNNLYPRVVFTIVCGIFTYLGVGISEEIFARGFIQQYFRKKGHVIVGILVSDIVFVAMHRINGVYSNTYQYLFVFFLGLVESILLVCYDNLWLCMGLHFGYDWGIVHLFEVNTNLIVKNSFFSVIKMTNWKASLAISGACLTVAAVFLLIRHIRGRKVFDAKEMNNIKEE